MIAKKRGKRRKKRARVAGLLQSLSQVTRNEQTNDENPSLMGFLVSMLLPPRPPFLR